MNEQKINKCGCGGFAEIQQNGRISGYFYVMCENCCNTTQEFRKKSEAITHWNVANSEISNAMQAVKWLEEGKKIESYEFDSRKKYAMLSSDGDNIYVYEKNKYNRVDSLHLSALFYGDWQIYEEQQYKEVDLEYALCQYALTGMNKNIRLPFKGEEYYIEELVRDSVNMAKLDDECGMNTFRDYLKGSIWRHYE